MDWKLLFDYVAILGTGLLVVFGLVALIIPKGRRLRALPRGHRRITKADLEEAHNRVWREHHAALALRQAGVR